MRVVFAGTPEFAERSLAALVAAGVQIVLVLTQPDRPAGRGQRPAESAVKRRALALGLPVFQPETLKDGGDSARRIAAAAPDLLVVVAYGLILPKEVLELAPLGALNVHASLLPRWRGAAPIQRAIMAGDAETGVSIMRLDEGLDTGPVYEQRRLPVAADDDAQSLHDKLARLGAELLVTTLAELVQGRARATPQPGEGASYARKIDKRDAELDWKRPAIELERVIRALRPSPGAHGQLRGQPVKIWTAHVIPGQGSPGAVLDVGADRLQVACGSGSLLVTELQRANGKRLPVGEFLRGHPIAVGERFSL